MKFRSGRRFEAYVEAHPGCLERSQFGALDAPRDIAQYPLQPWPVFVDAEEAMAQGHLATGLLELVAAVPERLLANDPADVAETFGVSRAEAEIVLTFLRHPGQRQSLVARGDFIERAEGDFQALELNVSSNLGGWQNVGWSELYRQVPVLQKFFDSAGPWRVIDTLGTLFEHLVDRHRERCQREGEDPAPFHVAFVAPADNQGRQGWFTAAQQRLDRLLAKQFSELAPGRVLGGTFDTLRERAGHLYAHDAHGEEHRVRVVVEATGGRLPGPVFASAMAGHCLVINGPVDRVLSNKKCLALLSEHADDPRLGEAGQALVRQHVPWTRVLGERYTEYRGERGYLPEIVEDHRDQMVLKPALGLRGEGIVFGHRVSEEDWQDAIDQALEDEGEGWVVQQRLAPWPRDFQHGERGAVPHDVVWGFFAFGQRYGGGFLRQLPQGRHGVVNAAQGATESPIFIADSD